MIQKTTNYEIFKMIEANRPLCTAALRKLQFSITHRNMLEFRPIDVDENMGIIDGQHRLEVAKTLKVPIYYQVRKNSKPDDIILLNNNQKSWSLSDYLNFYVRNNYGEYILLSQFLEKHSLNIRMAFTILGHSSRTRSFFSAFKSGRYKFPEQDSLAVFEKLENAKIIITHCQNRMIGSQAFLKNNTFLAALLMLMAYPEFNLQTFLKRIEYKHNLLTPKTCTDAYYRLLKYIYNWKNNKKIGEIFEEEQVSEPEISQMAFELN